VITHKTQATQPEVHCACQNLVKGKTTEFKYR